MVSVPQLTDPAAPTNGGCAAAPVRLAPDLATLDAERLILQAAAANATIQLGTIRMHGLSSASQPLSGVCELQSRCLRRTNALLSG